MLFSWPGPVAAWWTLGVRGSLWEQAWWTLGKSSDSVHHAPDGNPITVCFDYQGRIFFFIPCSKNLEVPSGTQRMKRMWVVPDCHQTTQPSSKLTQQAAPLTTLPGGPRWRRPISFYLDLPAMVMILLTCHLDWAQLSSSCLQWHLQNGRCVALQPMMEAYYEHLFFPTRVGMEGWWHHGQDVRGGPWASLWQLSVSFCN